MPFPHLPLWIYFNSQVQFRSKILVLELKQTLSNNLPNLFFLKRKKIKDKQGVIA